MSAPSENGRFLSGLRQILGVDRTARPRADPTPVEWGAVDLTFCRIWRWLRSLPHSSGTLVPRLPRNVPRSARRPYNWTFSRLLHWLRTRTRRRWATEQVLRLVADT